MIYNWLGKCPMIRNSGTALVLALSLSGPVSDFSIAASAESSESRQAVQIFANPDESSPVLESAADGTSLTPIAEMTGGGGLKWFMVKTKNGNVGWVKGDHHAVKRIDDHFRALPKDARFAPVTSAGSPTPTAVAGGAIKIPVKIYGPQVLVPVSFQNGSSKTAAHLVLDTGAMQTVVSKRMARDLQLLSIDSQTRIGISGSLVADVGLVDVVSVGSVGVRNMRVTIHDLPSGKEGLWRFDFLGRFTMSIDSENQELVLVPRKQ